MISIQRTCLNPGVKMLRVCFLAVLISVQVFSQFQESSKNLNLGFKNQPMRLVLDEIKDKSGINFIYKDDLVDKVNVTFRIDGNSAESVLEKLLNKYGIAYKIFEGNSYVLYKPEAAKEIKNIYKAILIEQPAPNMDPAVLLSKPKLISKLNPLYPPEAVKNNVEGNVDLKLFITKEGSVAKTLIENSSGSSILDSAAVRHSGKLKFFPAKENGKPKNVWISMIFKYQINGKNNDDPIER